MERPYARERDKLHTHRALFCCTVRKLQFLQDSKRTSIPNALFTLELFSKADIGYFSQFAEPTPGADLSPLRRLVCGGAAGITSVTFTYPLDIVRTRLSIQSASFATISEETRRKLPGMWATMVTMYKTEGGILALYRGILPTVAGVAPYVCAVACSTKVEY